MRLRIFQATVCLLASFAVAFGVFLLDNWRFIATQYGFGVILINWVGIFGSKPFIFIGTSQPFGLYGVLFLALGCTMLKALLEDAKENRLL